MKEKIRQFLSGRYGNDQLNTFLLFLVLLTIWFGRAAHAGLISFIGELLWIWALYRGLSRNIYRRRSENALFLEKTKIPRAHIRAKMMDIRDKYSRHFVCPGCGRINRVPRNQGKITITCPACFKKYDKKS